MTSEKQGTAAADLPQIFNIMHNQTYWLLEMIDLGKDGRPRYLWAFTPDGGYTYTNNPRKAMCWSTRTEAQLERNQLMPEYQRHLRTVEHIFTEREE